MFVKTFYVLTYKNLIVFIFPSLGCKSFILWGSAFLNNIAYAWLSALTVL